MQFEETMEKYYKYIYHFAMKLSCHPQLAEDITQETFLQAYKKLHQLKDDQAIKKWLRRICYNCFLMEYRKNKKDVLNYVEDIKELEQEGEMFSLRIPEPEEEVVVEEAIKELQNGCFYAMVRKLTLQQRIVFSLMDMFGLPLAETADMVQLSENATKGLLYRARKNLDAFFSGHCNLIKIDNPCCCKAWIDFRKSQEANHQKTRELLESINDMGKNYEFDEEIRNKLYYLYHHMPDIKPDQQWFNNILALLQDNAYNS